MLNLLKVALRIDDIVMGLKKRYTWALSIAEAGGGTFICSDHPANLELMLPFNSIQKQTPGDRLIFPLTRNVLLSGTVSREQGARLSSDRNALAAFNALTIAHSFTNAARYFHSTEPEFACLKG